jgi:hypothetical protein
MEKKMRKYIFASTLILLVGCGLCFGQDDKSSADLQYKLLATIKTSTMQKELDETAARGYPILVGSPTSDAEMAVFLSREGTVAEPFKYKLLATTRTGTMQKELNDAAADGFRLLPSTMIAKKQLIGGVEIVSIMERPPRVEKLYEYKLLATVRTSTLQKEVTEAKEAGFVLVGMVSRGEHMVIMERESSVKR